MCSSLAVANLYSGYVNSHHHCRTATSTRSAEAASGSCVLKIIWVVGIPMRSRMTAKAMVHETSSTVWPCTCFGMGCPGFSRKRKQTQTRAPSTPMKIPRVHQEISMKRSWMPFPKSDLGLTVVIGESHKDQPHEERTTATAMSRRTVGTRKGDRARRMGSFI